MFNILYSIKRRLGIATAEEYKTHLVSVGIKIGAHTKFFSSKITIDEQRPWMIEIGDYTKITSGVMILQHDYSRSVIRRVYGQVVGESKKTIIGDNVFIGVNAIILMGTHIGNNSIVGAGSIVSGVFPDNVVIAGNPGKIICTIEDYYNKRKGSYLDEAIETFLEFKRKKGREPTIQEMGSFWPLFLPKSVSELKKEKIYTNLSGDDEDDIIKCWLKEEAPFSDYQEFKDFIYKKVINDA